MVEQYQELLDIMIKETTAEVDAALLASSGNPEDVQRANTILLSARVARRRKVGTILGKDIRCV